MCAAVHRWLLLSFKREFAFDESLKLFEILCSHHLEISSLEAEKAKRKEELLEKERTGEQRVLNVFDYHVTAICVWDLC